MSEKPAFLPVIAFLGLIQVILRKWENPSITCQKTGYQEIRFFFRNKSLIHTGFIIGFKVELNS